ncbi:cysteine--tRNA ligase [Massilia sp. CF038]|uniref:cysteine--tRNA ligase n=1 Tax=Massilia sp. CF038 TaxID=1881045 RepID=UPI00091F8126|nr:cysteine--tRNA ligase [Massilia sp. CF038]SHH01773.1 cysteinyl-tRNA synthetase [Massilia sp. CF038]
MSQLKIYNTLARDKQLFVPIEAGKVGMYVCGMTIYDYCHIGHARMMMAFDVMYRWLTVSGYQVTYVRNITDIEDKIIKRAVENGESIYSLTSRFTQYMDEDTAALGILPPTVVPRATQYVPQMLGIIEMLEQKGLAYQSDDGDVNFAVRKFPGYGKLSGKSIDDLVAGAGARDVVNTDKPDQDKRDPLDFVLWKSSKESEPAEVKWESKWGSGRPGWHIECSAMSCATLGEQFDIHGGGADLQFPHHENEIAQSEGAFGHPMTNFWVHNGFVRVDGEKMSKSLGNFFTIRDVLKVFDPEVVRFFILRAHYRSPLNYSDVHLEDAKVALTRLYTALADIDLGSGTAVVDWNEAHAVRFGDAMDDDFNTPLALAALFDLATELNKSRSVEHARQFKALAAVIGLLERTPQQFLQGGTGEGALSPDAIEAQIAARSAAKKARNFAESDKIRADLLAAGIVLEDKPDGTTNWRRA